VTLKATMISAKEVHGSNVDEYYVATSCDLHNSMS